MSMSDRRVASTRESSAPALLASMVALLAICASLLFSSREMLVGLLRTNQLVQAFVASSLFGGLSLSLVMIGQILASWVRSSTFASVTILNKDEIFDKVLDFVGKHRELSAGALMAQTQRKRKTWKDWRLELTIGQRATPRVEYRPANNNDVHIFSHNGTRVLLTRSKGETVVTGHSRTPTQLETLTLSTWRGGAVVLKQLVEEAISASAQEESNELSVYVLSSGWLNGWERALSKKPRTVESVILDEDLAHSLLADARHFLSACDWYAETGIPYRRGYLLYGPPGCGKTSFCQALAGELKLDVCMLTLANQNLDDNSLAANLRDAPASSIVLLEDVDAVFVERSASRAQGTGVTFSGLLNALDGVASQEGRLFFMTTNHIDRLDSALIRPGRCDVKVELRCASHAQQRRLFARFFPEHAERAGAFASQLPEYEISMAQLQGYLLEHKTDPAGALANVPRLLRVTRPVVVDRTSIYEHLRRVGLEQWATTFEHHGVTLVSELGGLKLDDAKKWSHALRVDQLSARRMAQLVDGDAALMHAYRIADLATVKEMFLQTFAHPAPALGAGAAGHGTTGAPTGSHAPGRHGSADVSAPPYSRSPFEGIRRAAESSQLSQLSEALCSAVQREGRSAVSVWQLSRHLRLYEHDAALCVARAHVLVAERPVGKGASAPLLDEMSTYDWLRRAGLEEHADAFDDAGYASATSMYSLGADVLKERIGLRDRALAELSALLGADEGRPDLLVRLVPPDWRRLRGAFAARYTADALADGFADALSDADGRGKISLAQLDAFLAAHAHEPAAACATAVVAELLMHVRPERARAPEAAEPTEWVYTWLKRAGLEGIAACFIEHKLCTRERLLSDPPLQLADLAAIGVSTAGEQRAVLALLRQLAAEPETPTANAAPTLSS